ncbi:MAG: PQQ-dependent sugar dehydrogenase [Chloroflexi bacterium]|nr:PQQ-dependent sugar dehydrogenase [Chloroflexota bacterium]
MEVGLSFFSGGQTVRFCGKYLFSAAGVTLLALLVILTGCTLGPIGTTKPLPATTSPLATTTAPPTTSPLPETDIPLTTPLAQRLEIPWSLAFLPDGSIIFTERPGRVRLIDAQGRLLPDPVLTISEVAARGEGGLLGITLHPDFARNGFIYVYYTYQSGGRLANKVVRFTLAGRTLSGGKAIIEDIPGATIHDGGRIKFGPDDLLYIGAGDAGVADLAQDKSSLAGKILRLKDDGSIPPDNPFPGSPVYSYGHRNPQGLAWDTQGRLWETEHGSSAHDEVNLIQPGKNYGWPVIRGEARVAGMEPPLIESGNDTWAPSGLTFLDGSLFFTGLRGQSLFRLNVANPQVFDRYLNGSFGRLRDVVVGPDKMLYVLTNNRDGRGSPRTGDDQIIRINPGKL